MSGTPCGSTANVIVTKGAFECLVARLTCFTFRGFKLEIPKGPSEAKNGGGRWRIRTPVSGSEGRKDIQTTLIARSSPEWPPLLEEGGSLACRTTSGDGGFRHEVRR